MPKTDFIDGVTVVTDDWADAMQEHTHDGVDDDGSAPKIDLKNHLDTGTNGFLELVGDTPTKHRIEHKGSGSTTSEFRSDVLESDSVETASVLIGGTPGERVWMYASVASPNTTAVIQQDSGAAATVEVGGFKPSIDEPNPGSFVNFNRQDATLYRGNLVKFQSVHKFTKLAGTNTINAVKESSYNLALAANWSFNAGSNLFEIEVPNHDFSGNVQASIEQFDESIGSAPEIRIRRCTYDSANNKLVLRLLVRIASVVGGHNVYAWSAIDQLGPNFGLEMNFRIHVTMI